MDLNDELLCAYMDGELERGELERVAQALERDAGARLRLARMQTSDARLRAEIPLAVHQESDSLARRILETERAPKGAPRARRFASWTSGLAIAAGLGGVALGYLLSQAGSAETRLALGGFAQGSLLTALEHAQSGGTLAQGADGATMILTVEAQDGRYCRLFRLREHGSAGEGVACREGGDWRVMAWDATVIDGAEFRTAGANAVMDAALDRLGGEALAPLSEQGLIVVGWKARSRD